MATWALKPLWVPRNASLTVRAPGQLAQERRPEGLGLGWDDLEVQHLASAIRTGAHYNAGYQAESATRRGSRKLGK